MPPDEKTPDDVEVPPSALELHRRVKALEDGKAPPVVAVVAPAPRRDVLDRLLDLS